MMFRINVYIQNMTMSECVFLWRIKAFYSTEYKLRQIDVMSVLPNFHINMFFRAWQMTSYCFIGTDLNNASTKSYVTKPVSFHDMSLMMGKESH